MPRKHCNEKCLFCGKKTGNPKFCDRSCAASYNNIEFPKRTVETQNLCMYCGTFCFPSPSMKESGISRCKKCWQENKIAAFGNKTKGELVAESTSYASKHRYEKIRQYGKRLSEFYGWKSSSCEKCGYSKHTELCHKKSIQSFTDNTKVSTINSRDNIIYLCPNCHWELDNLG